ncbi:MULTISPECIES: gamma-mobile-trio recombinase GmtY [Pseudomonas]|uniref:gamma-mobile-trio recombinase GmtY n=1 Tax=Pseudomonas TaxID=286 RepID=UPI000AAE26FB|nr:MULTISPECIES: gamma-mobile-trio recombinase GmtY [Pseudomonas]MBP2081777.1 hypothetical protein [Pseudomonas sp. PvP089]MBP2086606.1 hypothetical protein [Pseudomonas sp. PvP088]MBP2221233.1 hypothetical protein [Pseudomonas putida]MEC4878415.1 gamma-mobile-trio recombinase GmtY [Pseudomonas sp. NC26]
MAYVLKINTLYQNDKTGREVMLPALITQDGILISLLRFLSQAKKSASWMERCVYAVQHLIQFINANEGKFTKVTELLQAFVNALELGTIDVETSTDPTGLYWVPRKVKDSSFLLYLITVYSDWLAEQDGHSGARANPFRKATRVEERINWCAYHHKEQNIFLRHLIKDRSKASNAHFVRQVRAGNAPSANRKITKRFPESEIDNLLVNGWVRTCNDPGATEHDFIDYKGRAITILMHYGGLRKSEPFHWYLGDLVLDKKKGEGIVRIWHPSNGRSPEKGYRNRRDYLQRRYRLLPRTDYVVQRALYAGWKAPKLIDGDDGYIEIYFSPVEKAKEFYANYMNYLKYQRVDPPPEFDHPYAFTNSSGHPETIKNFSQQHRAAVERIGLPHKKAFGTTEHGHRHAYGFRLAAYGFSGVFISKAMHHKNLNSHLVYIEPSSEDIRDEMERVEGKQVEV